MNKYLDALYRLDDGEHTIEDFELLKKLAKDKDEQDSRKDKLVVGSEWECVVDCTVAHITDIAPSWKGDEIQVTKIVLDVIEFRCLNDTERRKQKYTVGKDQFLLCFKPKEITDD